MMLKKAAKGYFKNFTWFKFRLLVIASFFALNWCYHAVRKPAEIVGVFDSHFYKDPNQTWKAHGDSFVENATDVITPDFLAALAQVETHGNAIARTYWHWN